MSTGDEAAQGMDDRAADAVEGLVTAQLPSGLYAVEVDGRHRVIAHVGAGRGRNFIRILVGDRVSVELMPADPTRGRIRKKLPA